LLLIEIVKKLICLYTDLLKGRPVAASRGCGAWPPTTQANHAQSTSLFLQ